jgi:hypothetical protein
MGRMKGAPRTIRNHRHNQIRVAPRKKRSITYRHRGNPIPLLANQTRRANFRRILSRRAPLPSSLYNNKSVWGSGAPVLSLIDPRLRHEILTETTQDMLFRNLPILQQMLRDHRRGTPFSLYGNSVKFILVIAHGYIVGTTACPRNMGIFHITENEARNNPVGGDKVAPALETILGERGSQFSTFLTSKLGTIHSENPIVDSVAYSTFGPDPMPEFHLWKTGRRGPDPLDTITGVFDITSALQGETFEPSDFNYLNGRTPEQRRPGRYRELLPLTDLLRADARSRYHPRGGSFDFGTSLGTLCRTLQDPAFSRSQMTNYDTSLCFMFVICCTGMDPTLSVANASTLKSRFPAYTSYAVPFPNS